MKKIKLYIIRHGKTAWNELGIAQGLTDIPLNEEGKRQAQEVAKQIPLDDIDIIFTSPLKRAKQTADLINGNKKEIIIDELLVERCFGDFEGKPIPFAIITKQWTNLNDKEGGSESARECLARAKKFLTKLKQDYRGKSILVVSHGGFIKALHFNIIGYDEDTDFLSFRPDNATVYEYEI